MKIATKLFAILLLTLWSLPALAQARRIEKVQGKEVMGGEIIVRFRLTASEMISTIRRDSDTESLEQLGRSGDVVIRSRKHSTAELLQTYSSRTDVEYVEPNRIWHKTSLPNDP